MSKNPTTQAYRKLVSKAAREVEFALMLYYGPPRLDAKALKALALETLESFGDKLDQDMRDKALEQAIRQVDCRLLVHENEARQAEAALEALKDLPTLRRRAALRVVAGGAA